MQTTYSTSRIIWEGKAFSSGTYICRIEQDEDKNAKLTITLEGLIDTPIHEEPIVLKIDSSGGPEQDVEKWKLMCDNIIDHPKFRSSVSELSEWFRQ